MTPLGYITLPIGLAGLLFSSKWLYRLFVFWTLFSASSVANFGEGDSGSALQVWMFFGFLWLLRLILERLSTLSFSIDHRILRPTIWLIAFLGVATISLAMPAYIDGRLSITSPILGDGTEAPLYLTTHNFTQLMYLIFGGTIAICVAHANLDNHRRHDTERIILLSAIFISLWGILQFVCNVTGIPYPDFVFNNSGSASGKGFLQTLEAGVGRISSTAVEPSVFAQSLISLLPLTIPAFLRRGSVISIPADRLCAGLFIVLLVLSTSSTAYLGILIFGILLLAVLLRSHLISVAKASVLAVFAAGGLAAVAVLAFVSVPIVSQVANSALLNKSSSGSGLERLMTITLAWGYFRQFPILGIGWGSATSHDLLVKLLSNVGVAGTIIFLAAMFSVIRSNWRGLDELVAPEELSRSVWFLALTVFLITSLLIEFPLAFGNFWLVLGMALATSWNVDKSQISNIRS